MTKNLRVLAVPALLLAVAACGSGTGTHVAAVHVSATPSATSTVPVPSATPSTHPTEQTPSPKRTVSPPPTITTPPTGPANLVLSPQALDVNDPGFDLINTGGAPMDYVLDWTDNELGLVPNSGRIAPGGYAIIRLEVHALHDIYAEKSSIAVHWNGNTTSMPVTGRYDTGPALEDFKPPSVQMCPGRTGVVAVHAADLEGIRSLTLVWTEKDSNGTTLFVGANPMSQISGNQFVGEFQGTINRLPMDDPGPSGQLLWHVQAFDSGGKESPDSARHEITLFQHC